MTTTKKPTEGQPCALILDERAFFFHVDHIDLVRKALGDAKPLVYSLGFGTRFILLKGGADFLDREVMVKLNKGSVSMIHQWTTEKINANNTSPILRIIGQEAHTCDGCQHREMCEALGGPTNLWIREPKEREWCDVLAAIQQGPERVGLKAKLHAAGFWVTNAMLNTQHLAEGKDDDGLWASSREYGPENIDMSTANVMRRMAVSTARQKDRADHKSTVALNIINECGRCVVDHETCGFDKFTANTCRIDMQEIVNYWRGIEDKDAEFRLMAMWSIPGSRIRHPQYFDSSLRSPLIIYAPDKDGGYILRKLRPTYQAVTVTEQVVAEDFKRQGVDYEDRIKRRVEVISAMEEEKVAILHAAMVHARNTFVKRYGEQRDMRYGYGDDYHENEILYVKFYPDGSSEIGCDTRASTHGGMSRTGPRITADERPRFKVHVSSRDPIGGMFAITRRSSFAGLSRL